MIGIIKFLGNLFIAAVAFPPVLVPGGGADRSPVQCMAYRDPVRFEALSIEQGLSQSSVVASRRIGDGPYELIVRDNGVGLPAGFGLETCESLGLQIVRDLVAQLEGTVRVENLGGTVYTIKFQAPAAKGSGGGER